MFTSLKLTIIPYVGSRYCTAQNGSAKPVGSFWPGFGPTDFAMPDDMRYSSAHARYEKAFKRELKKEEGYRQQTRSSGSAGP